MTGERWVCLGPCGVCRWDPQQESRLNQGLWRKRSRGGHANHQTTATPGSGRARSVASHVLHSFARRPKWLSHLEVTGSEAVLRGRARATSLLLLSIPWKGSCLPSVHRPGPVRARDAAAPQHRLRQGPQAPSPSTWPADAQRLFGKRHQSSGKEPARQRSRGSGPGPRQGSAGSR